MKYFLPYDAQTISSNEETQIVIQQSNAYAAYLDTVRERLPASLRYITEHINFGDYQIQEANVDLPSATVLVKIMGETITFRAVEQEFLLRFVGVSNFTVTNPVRQDPAPFLAMALEVEIHEVEVIEPDSFEFRFLFHGRTEIAIRFKEFDYEIISVVSNDPNGGVGVKVADRIVEAEREARAGKLGVPTLREIATKSAEGDDITHYRLGRLAMSIGDYQLAVDQFTVAVDITPDHTSNRFALAKAKFAIQEYHDAFLLIQGVLTENPKHTGVLLYYVRILAAMEQWDVLATTCTEYVLSISGEVRLLYALALAETDRVEEAIAIYEPISKPIRNRNAALNKRVLSMLLPSRVEIHDEHM